MNQAGILGKRLEELGLYVEEEEDLLTLKHGDQVIARWYPSLATKEEIRKTARRWARKHDMREEER